MTLLIMLQTLFGPPLALFMISLLPISIINCIIDNCFLSIKTRPQQLLKNTSRKNKNNNHGNTMLDRAASLLCSSFLFMFVFNDFYYVLYTQLCCLFNVMRPNFTTHSAV